jgi:hypothetical protein
MGAEGRENSLRKTPTAFSGKDNTQHQANLVLNSPIRGNDRVSSFLEVSYDWEM